MNKPGTFIQDAEGEYWLVLAQSFNCHMKDNLVTNLFTGVVRTIEFLPKPVKAVTPQEIMW